MKAVRLLVIALASAHLVAVGARSVCTPATAGGPLQLPEWFDQVRAFRLTYYPHGTYWADESALASENVLRARAAKALRQLNDARPRERMRALWKLRTIVGVIPFPEGLAAIERVCRTDPHAESLMRIRCKGEPPVRTTAYTVREAADPALALLKDRLVWEKWLAKQPLNKRAGNAVKLLSGPGYSRHGLPDDQGVIVVWLMRHPADSLPILTKVESGRPSIGRNGTIPTVKTPNSRARVAAASVIGANKARRYAPYLLSLLDDPTCDVQTAAQPLPPGVGGKIEPRNLVRSYPVRDAAAGALQALGYAVTFDGKRYHASPPSPSRQRDSSRSLP
jgi:hypothetical protein